MGNTATNWFEIWVEDKRNMIATMARNMAADLAAGYDYFGKSIQDQIKMIDDYKKAFDEEMDKIAEMEPSRVNHYCYVKLKKAGAI